MAAQLLRQSPQLRNAFTTQVRNKTAAARDAVGQRVEERLAGAPQTLRSVVQWSVKRIWDSQNHQYARRGQQGERQLTAALRWRLSSAWWLIPDVLISADGQNLSQLDLMLVGPPGCVVVEVKHWAGAFRATGDRWARKDGARWVPCESPTRQNTAHERQTRAWWRAVGLETQLGPLPLYPVVVLLETSWLRVSNPPMPVFDRPSALARHVQTLPIVWTPEAVERAAHTVAEQPSPLRT